MTSALKHIKDQTNFVGMTSSIILIIILSLIDINLGLMRCIKRDVCSFLMCNEVNIYIFDNQVQKYYLKEGGILESYVIDNHLVERVIFRKLVNIKTHKVMPGFKSYIAAKKGIKEKNLLVLPALVTKDETPLFNFNMIEKLKAEQSAKDNSINRSYNDCRCKFY